MIRHHEAVGQHLKGVESRINHDIGLRHLALDGIGEAEEKRVARGEDDDGFTIYLFTIYDFILLENIIEGYGNVDPLGIGRQQRRNNLMMPLATREHLPVLDDLQHLRRKPRLWIVCDTYNNESLHKFVKFV